MEYTSILEKTISSSLHTWEMSRLAVFGKHDPTSIRKMRTEGPSGYQTAVSTCGGNSFPIAPDCDHFLAPSSSPPKVFPDTLWLSVSLPYCLLVSQKPNCCMFSPRTCFQSFDLFARPSDPERS